MTGITKRAGCNHCARAVLLVDVLVPEAQFLDDLPVIVDIGALQVVQETEASANHLEEPTASVVILLVVTEVIGEVVDALCEQRDLNACRPAVSLMQPVLRDSRSLCESHDLVNSPAPQIGAMFNVRFSMISSVS